MSFSVETYLNLTPILLLLQLWQMAESLTGRKFGHNMEKKWRLKEDINIVYYKSYNAIVRKSGDQMHAWQNGIT